jgi:hypothetical protein
MSDHDGVEWPITMAWRTDDGGWRRPSARIRCGMLRWRHRARRRIPIAVASSSGVHERENGHKNGPARGHRDALSKTRAESGAHSIHAHRSVVTFDSDSGRTARILANIRSIDEVTAAKV